MERIAAIPPFANAQRKRDFDSLRICPSQFGRVGFFRALFFFYDRPNRCKHSSKNIEPSIFMLNSVPGFMPLRSLWITLSVLVVAPFAVR